MGDVALRPWPASKKEKLSSQDIVQQIEQLTLERGHLRDITEKSLQDDIAAGKDAPETITSEKKEEKKEKQTKDERLQDVFRAQQEMINHMEYVPKYPFLF